MGGEGKLIKSLRGAAQKYLGVGFLLGFFLVLLTYFTLSEQFAITAPNAVKRPSSSPAYAAPTTPAVEAKKDSPVIIEKEPPTKAGDEEDTSPVEEMPTGEVDDTFPVEDARTVEEHEKNTSERKPSDTTTMLTENAPPRPPACDIQGPFVSDVCDVDGDVHIHGSDLSILIAPPPATSNPSPQEWRIRPYSRKMDSIREVTVKELPSAADVPPCAVRSPVPAMVFAMGGLTGNYWHDFSDILIPLYLATRRFDGEVQLVVENIQGWYVGKYKRILDKLSKYDIVDMDKDDQVRCFPHAVVGIRMHKEFSIDPARPPVGNSMPAFTKFLRETFSLPRDAPMRLTDDVSKKPRLMIISRRHPRKFTNLNDIVALATRVGFDVVVGDPPFNVDVGEFAKEVNAADVLVGVHGAGLTNSLFLPTGAVFIQVVPYGKMEHIGKVDFGDPAVDMGLKYVAYSAGVEESTLVELLGRDHPAVRDPESVHQSGWGKVAEYYLGKQDVRLDLRRFEPVLMRALELLRE